MNSNASSSAASTTMNGSQLEHVRTTVVADKRKTSDETTLAASQAAKLNARIADPLRGLTVEQLRQDANGIAQNRLGLSAEEATCFELGAVLAQDGNAYEKEQGSLFRTEQLESLAYEAVHRWASIPKTLWFVVVLNSLCAAVQGMDETVVNGAQIFFNAQFGIEDQPWIKGLVNSAPYLACAVVGCWLSIPLNQYLGRRGTIFVTCLCDVICCICQALVHNWWQLFIVRFLLGLGIGAKSATVPLYSAECAPSAIRGGLTMQWQMWTAFGIMLGYASDLAFFRVADIYGIVGLNWRLMLGSASICAMIVCCGVWSCPESPRWLMSKSNDARRVGKDEDARKSLLKAWYSMKALRSTDLQAARDMYLMVKLQEAEDEAAKQRKSAINELFCNGRNRRAMIASEICMFMQQFCGINIIAYYSSVIFLEAGFSEQSALLASLGFGIINFLFALPAVYTIDKKGRRWLLLLCFPLMALCLFFTGFSFMIKEPRAHIACIALGIYLFGIVYSPGEGPVPFTYSAEAYPLYIRTVGMSLATATTWFFNFVLSITWPALLAKMGPTGAFCYYGGWNLVGAFMVLILVPETMGWSLEQLDQVFSVSTTDMINFGLAQALWGFRYVSTFGKTTAPAPDYKELMALDEVDGHTDHTPSSQVRGPAVADVEKRS